MRNGYLFGRNARFLPMLPSPARSLGRRFLRPPTHHKTSVYGIIAGLIAGVVWLVIELASLAGPFLPATSPVSSFILSLSIALAPVFLIAVTGARLGRRTGSARDGFIAGGIAGGVFCFVFLLGFEVLEPQLAIGGPRAWHASAVLVLLDFVKWDVVGSVICALIGGVVGLLSALGGRHWHRGGQRPCRETAGLAVSRIRASDTAGDVVVAAVGDELPREA